MQNANSKMKNAKWKRKPARGARGFKFAMLPIAYRLPPTAFFSHNRITGLAMKIVE
jgi:hypothetical protein